MNAKYTYLAGATAANILADLVAILTSETNVNNLSASCNKPFTTIESITAAGWTLHDAAAGTNAKCLRAPLADDAATFKYVVIDTNTAGYVITKVYETWNASTHVGTNLAFNSDVVGYQQRVSTTVAGSIYLFATARFMLLASLYSGQWGSITNSGPSGCFERTRQCAWDTVAAGWPPFLFCNLGDLAAISDGLSAYAPRYMDRARTTLSGSSAPLYGYTGPFGADASKPSVYRMFTQLSGVSQRVPDETGGYVIPFYPITFLNYATMPEPYGEISSLCDVWALPQGVAANLDVLQKGGLDFICLQGSTTTKMFAVRKG
ncbi:MAG: hypothetical protein HQL95_05280 [Magnetococcales bacterium]|nr:hypothetical protein [Magnetococcales bacterium]